MLGSYLASTGCMDDWGTILGNTVNESPPFLALDEVRDEIMPLLIQLLDRKQRVFLSGSESCTVSERDQFRTCDYAYVLLCRLTNREVTYDHQPQIRDRTIAALRADLKAKMGHAP